jgi:glycolate oxidase
MNRIIKLDDKNMYAVVEPYVTARQVQVETAKKGLTCHVIGCGSQSSILASATSMGGHGHSAHTTSTNARNLLGAEWVMPTGEVVSWGLVDEGKAGHPGPGFMGICRGSVGVMGSLGIFTKAVVKLYPWPGPAEMEITGRSPNLGFRIPDNFKVYHLRFAGPEKIGDAIYKLADAGIAYHIWHFPLFFHPQRWMGESNDEHYEIWKRFEAAGIIDKSLDALTVVLAAYSEKELNYKQKVIKDIMSETTGAEELRLPAGLATEEHDAERFFAAQIAVHKPCTEFRLGGGDMGTSWVQIQSEDGNMKGKRPVREIQRKYVAQGKLIDNAGESAWGGPIEQKALGHIEFMHFTDPTRPELLKAQIDFMEEATEVAIKEKLLGDGIGTNPAAVDKVMSKYLGGYFDYRRKIKEALDPNSVADQKLYLA